MKKENGFGLRPLFQRKNVKFWGDFCLEQDKVLSGKELD